MLAREWMTKDVITVGPDTSMMKAARLMKDNNISRIPVVDDRGELLGIVSDRDIKEASPSKATTLDMHELYYLLSELKVKDIMTKNPMSAKEDDSIESIAVTMTEKDFGGMPIVNEANKVVGIITDNDIFKVLISITGAKSGGPQLSFERPNEPGSLREILAALREQGANVVSVLTVQDEGSPTRRVYIRLSPMSEDKQKTVVDSISSKFPLLHFEPGIKV